MFGRYAFDIVCYVCVIIIAYNIGFVNRFLKIFLIFQNKYLILSYLFLLNLIYKHSFSCTPRRIFVGGCLLYILLIAEFIALQQSSSTSSICLIMSLHIGENVNIQLHQKMFTFKKRFSFSFRHTYIAEKQYRIGNLYFESLKFLGSEQGEQHETKICNQNQQSRLAIPTGN